MHRLVHAVRLVELLPHIGVNHSHDAVHQHFHLSGNAEKEQGKTPDDNVGGFQLFACCGHVVVFDKAASVRATPTGKASSAGLNVQTVDKNIFRFVIAIGEHSIDECFCRHKGSALFVFRAGDHYQNFLCHGKPLVLGVCPVSVLFCAQTFARSATQAFAVGSFGQFLLIFWAFRRWISFGAFF